ncbi:phosphatidylglycerol lysyltransferase domain-containing protein [Brevundimonas sp.]|uniref:phosphatidylglycerol lysyltransferase domain-containing protein n=1 Tax=Brevundimonas sp. TaxID=1871086 RepID=UPI0039E54B96
MIEDTDDDRASGRDQRQWLRWAGPVVGTVVFLVAAVVISGELRQVSWREVEAAATATPLTSMVLALTALVVSLGAASSFDRLALASLGRSASWRKTWQPSMLAFALANAGAPGLAPSVARLGSFVYAEGGSLYGFEELRAFKQKFNPRWDPVYIAAPTSWMLGPALADAALLSSGGLMGALR